LDQRCKDKRILDLREQNKELQAKLLEKMKSKEDHSLKADQETNLKNGKDSPKEKKLSFAATSVR
jgi:hypothetical protein